MLPPNKNNARNYNHINNNVNTYNAANYNFSNLSFQHTPYNQSGYYPNVNSVLSNYQSSTPLVYNSTSPILLPIQPLNRPPPPPMQPPPPNYPPPPLSSLNPTLTLTAATPSLYGPHSYPFPNQIPSSTINNYQYFNKQTNIPQPSINMNAPNNLTNFIINDKQFKGNNFNKKPPSKQNQVFYCEPCDKEFLNMKSFESHKTTHEFCRHPECKFNATKKVVIAHYHSTHGQFSGSGYQLIDVEGQKFRVLLGSSSEEIEQWRQERKKNFPTKDNIEKKATQTRKLIESGAIDFDKSNTKKNKKRNRDKKVNSNSLNNNNSSLNDEKIKNDESNPIESDILLVKEQEQDEKRRKVDEINQEITQIVDTNKNLPTRPCKHYAQGKCKNGENCKFSHNFEPKVCKFYLQHGKCFRSKKGQCSYYHDKSAREEYLKTIPETSNCSEKNNISHSDKKKRGNKNKLTLPEPLDGGNRGTLLKKLLANEIQNEENKILQCLRYLVKFNFFEDI